MSRRDIIIIGVLLNVGLLSVLFMMAIGKDEGLLEQPANQMVVTEPAQQLIPIQPETTHIAQANLTATDEWDSVIKDYAANIPSQTLVLEEEAAEELEKESAITPILLPETRIATASGDFVEVKVKRGDALEKIARANGTTVEKIRKANDLANDRLSVGQTLRVPVKGVQVTEIAKKEAPKKDPVKKEMVAKSDTPKAEKKEMSTLEKEYYTIKSGDNPWKIAKQYRVKFNDLLKLNDLDEEKARNLKIGDRIRVR